MSWALRRPVGVCCACGVFGIMAGLMLACGGSQSTAPGSYAENAERGYQDAMEDFHKGRCDVASPLFSDVRKRFPYSRYAALAELRVADCQFKEKKYIEAIQGYRRFIRSHPAHPSVAYAKFKIADAYVQQIPHGWFLTPPDHERDQGATRDALRQLRLFLQDHPNHARSADARDMLRKVLRLLAQHEVYVARFYFRREKYRATAMRLRDFEARFGGTGLEAEALWLQGRSLKALQQHKQADARWQRLRQRYPKSEYAAKARASHSPR
ncbi:MAG: outer membrane protein assembly factor BamD [Polyangiales bacterium]